MGVLVALVPALGGEHEAAAPGATDDLAVMETGDYVPGEVVVGYRNQASPADRADVRELLGLQRIDDLGTRGAELLQLPRGTNAKSAAQELERHPDVRYAEPNYIYRVGAATPNDPSFQKLWGLHNTGQVVSGVAGTPDADIDAPEAWAQETGDPNVVVAVVDTGISSKHPDLSGNTWTNVDEVPDNSTDDDGNGYVDDVHGYDFIDNDGDPADFHMHGTHVAGTIGATGDDAYGITGVSWDVSLMGVRVLGSDGVGTATEIAQGFDYAGDEGADIVNASLGGGDASNLMRDVMSSHRGTLFVVAAGNGGFDGVGDNNDAVPTYPCNYRLANVLCVAATNSHDGLARFSNYGATSVDMAAPGVNIRSTLPSWGNVTGPYSFESDLEGWTTGGTSDWTRTNEASSLGDWSLTDSPGENYAANADLWARSPELDLSNRNGCRLLFDVKLEVESTFDPLRVQTSPDNSKWSVAARWSGSTRGSFIELSAPIEALDGDGSAWVRFRFNSDESLEFDGAHIDNVRIQCLDGSFDADDYGYLNGTSMATPHVAGAAALLVAADPTATVAEIKNRLMNHGDALSALSMKTVSGRRLNVARALAAPAILDPPQMKKPSTKWQRKKRVVVTWKHSSLELISGADTTFNVRARRSQYDGGFAPSEIVESSVSGGRTTFEGKPGSTYCLRVRAVEGTTRSRLSDRKCTSVPADDRALSAGRAWSDRRGKGYYSNTFRLARKRGATLQRRKVKAREIALVVEKCQSCGAVRVFWKGKDMGRVKLWANRTKKRVIVPVRSFKKNQRGTLKIRTLSDRRVAIDGIAVRL